MVHGLLLVKKPKDITSHQLVARARRLLKTQEVGHAGTLDPLASGLMILLVGEATKLSEYVLNGDKGYRVKVQLGLTTDTLDTTGQVTSQRAVDATLEQISSAAASLVGEFKWPVPMFSAVKKEGQKLYELARQNQVIETPVKTMKFWDLHLIEVTPTSVEAELRCSKGSFIRTWADQLGQKLGCGGVVAELDRIYSAPYKASDATTLEQIEAWMAEGLGPESWGSAYVPVGKALPHFRALTVRGRDEKLLLSGQVSHDLARRLIVEQKEATQTQKTIGIKVLCAEKGDLLSLIEAQPNRGLKIRRVFKKLA
jgi:tRNA pseudouridine55 synthase